MLHVNLIEKFNIKPLTIVPTFKNLKCKTIVWEILWLLIYKKYNFIDD